MRTIESILVVFGAFAMIFVPNYIMEFLRPLYFTRTQDLWFHKLVVFILIGILVMLITDQFEKNT